VDYLDLYFCHRPDPNTPISETVRAMHDLITQGKVLYWGTSEWSADQIQEAFRVAKEQLLIPPTMEQPQYNLFWRDRFEKEYAPLFQQHGLGTTIWSPLASGLLSGKYNATIPDDTRLNRADLNWIKEKTIGKQSGDKLIKTRALSKLAQEIGTTPACMAIAWCLKNPNVSTAILGASKPAQLEENLKAIDALPLLTDEIMQRIEGIVENKPAAESTEA
jgi:aryl-alcohol dehydrogenase-like predicted oxidoreductase